MMSGVLATASALPLIMIAPDARAQVSGPPETVEAAEDSAAENPAAHDIVVTAQRRAESLQDIPLTVTSLSSQALDDASIRNLEELKTLVPGYQGPGDNGASSPHIRGVGSTAIQPGSESVVALYIDDIYIGAPTPALLALNNVQRIDVLKGPQGTLFGRNTTGGVVQVTTRSPSDTAWTGEATAGYGNYQTFTGTFYAGGPIADGISTDFAGQVETQGDGWGTNLFDGRDVYRTELDLGLRTRTIIRVGPNTELQFAGDYERNKNTGMNVLTPNTGSRSIFGYVSPARGWDADSNVQNRGRTEAWGINGRLRHDLGFADFISITAYRDTEFRSFGSDVDGTPAAGLATDRTALNRQFTQEFQLSSSGNAGFNWTAGLFYYHAIDDNIYFSTVSPLVFGGVTAQAIDGELVTKSYAAYAQGTMRLGAATNLTLGLRYTDEMARQDAQTDLFIGAIFRPGTPIIRETADESPTWRVAIDHHFTPDIMAYASYNRGQKSGGFNVSNPATPAYFPEKLDAYEMGIRTESLSGRLTLNASAFYYDYTNIQVLGFVGTQTQLFNGAGAELYGLDADFRFRATDRVTLSGGFAYLNSEFTSFPNAVLASPRPTGGYTQVSGSAAGNDLPLAPRFTASLTGTYRLPINSGDWRLSATYYYNDGYFMEADNRVAQAPHHLVSASLLYTTGRTSVRLWGSNLANEQVYSQVVTSTFNSIHKLNSPRTFGVTLGYRY